MCEFKSMIVTKSGDVLLNYQESHEGIIEQFKNQYDLRDETADPDKLLFARVEIVPPFGDVFKKDLSKWSFKIDQSITPVWWNDSLKNKCFDRLKDYLAEVVFDGQKIDMLENKNGIYIRNSKITVVKNSNIIRLSDSSIVEFMSGSSIVKFMSGSSIVEFMSDSSIVEFMSGSSIVKFMSGSSIVKFMSGSSIVIDKKNSNPIIKVANPNIKLELFKKE